MVDLPSNNYVGLFGATSGNISNIGLTNVSVSGDGTVGGLVGFQYGGTITNAYATGSVTGNMDVGGLVGGQYYGGTITNSFWDTTTSGQTAMCGYYIAGGSGCDDSYGKTTAEMKILYTFNSNGG